VLVYFGTGSAAASAYAIALHALLLVPIIIAGFVMLWLNHVSLGEVMNRGEDLEGTITQAPAPGRLE
jgi:hypothetical protein